MGKTIVFCADGTWNGPGPHNPNVVNPPDPPTNVFGFYRLLAPVSMGAPSLQPEQEKTVSDGKTVLQVAKYLHGVGHSDNWLTKTLGGAVGTGTVSRIVRGYTFISRHYQPGDRIVLVGFSRGAYTVRALAGLIAAQGLLPAGLPAGGDEAYSLGLRVWHAHRSRLADQLPTHAVAIMADLLAKVLNPPLPPLRPVDAIDAVAVWDTVGALGIPCYDNDGGRRDTFRFADTKLDPKVRLGLHAVSVDDLRADFTPTLWQPDHARIVQVLFPGAHADVGGGYRADESPLAYEQPRLSDCALVWMIDMLEHAGLGLQIGDPEALSVCPLALAAAHDEQVTWLYRDRPPLRRQFPTTDVLVSQAAAERWGRNVTTIPQSIDGKPYNASYQPENLVPFTNGDHVLASYIHLPPSQQSQKRAMAG